MAHERGQRLVRRVLTVLRRTCGQHAISAHRPALEELLLGVLADGSSERKAATALESLTREFVDWNEVRVSSGCEIAEAMPNMSRAVEKAEIVRSVLYRVFDVANEMSLDFLRDKSEREAIRLVAGIDGFPESALARAMIFSLGHEVFPLTPGVLAVCRRLGLLNNSSDRKDMIRRIERFVPKEKMFEFHWLLSQHAGSVCSANDPDCSECKLLNDCRTGRGKTGRPRRSGGARRAVRKKRESSRR